tara:strand:+ start:182 stop:514 length:333 start_codon:yes stop_codon:yes gene_type:complete
MDVVNYSKKMAVDDEGTLKQLAVCKNIIEKTIASAEGRIFNTAGDAFMIEFSSPVQAVSSAIKIQKETLNLNKELDKDNTLAKIKKGMEIWHEMTVYEEMMPVYLEYGLK